MVSVKIGVLKWKKGNVSLDLKLGVNVKQPFVLMLTKSLGAGPQFSGMLPGHRRMRQGDVIQMNSMMKAGIAPSHICASLANQCGGYDKIGFRKAGIYNQILQQRRRHTSDAMVALQFLHDLNSEQSPMYFDHTEDQEGRLQHLFWSDGRSQKEYELFGDVLAFDATYGKNKYLLPIVIFPRVNNHNCTTKFATAVVANECEETYVWLLEQLSKAIKGKHPSDIITDGDVAMKNAIKRVFPFEHHRLCGWHLLRNETSNVHIPKFTAEFERCMLVDYDVEEFEENWA
ncbi:MULE transposase domain [Sesbania bispinosa]|nr:MULE transposase domain [Sesbania bispinosa]